MAKIYSLTGKRIFVAGHRGMAGSSVVRRLQTVDCQVLTVTRQELDLRRQAEVEAWLGDQRPDVVIIAAALSGGIQANMERPAEFIRDNLAIECNLIHGAWQAGVGKLLFLGSTCIYPRLAAQPMAEESLLTGSLEPTNEWYAIAKIAGIKMCQAYRRQYDCDFIAATPTNIYGIGDRFHAAHSHVAAALMLKIHQAKVQGLPIVELWGTGTPLREFMFSEDMADGCVFLLEHYSDEPHVNIGSGRELSIRQLAELIARVVGWDGEIRLDPRKPDGMPRKMIDSSRMTALGWEPAIPIAEGMARAYAWFLANRDGSAAE